MVLLIDNYDSFTYNLAQLALSFENHVQVVRNDEITTSEIEKLQPSHIIISSGPGYPKDAGVCKQLVLKAGPKIPILGVGLGHQVICDAFGARISHAQKLMHGIKGIVNIEEDCAIFNGLSKTIEAACYHSLTVEEDSLPAVLTVTARDETGEIMTIKHSQYEIYGLQFNPESILTPFGRIIIKNFLAI